MKPAAFKYHQARTVEEAVMLLAEFAPQEAKILAGGQSLVPSMAFRLAKPAHLIDINGIAELGKVTIEGATVRIGACVRHAYFDNAEIAGPTGALLRKIVRHIAHYPIRTRGTLCGSVANADPASEWCALLAALDGVIIAHSARGRRRIEAADFFDGLMTTTLQDDEMITEVELPLLPEGTRIGFAEFSQRTGDFAIAMVIVALGFNNGRFGDVRCGLGGAEATPRRISQVEAALNGVRPSREIYERAETLAASAIDPLEDLNADGAYRRRLVRTLTRRALEGAT